MSEDYLHNKLVVPCRYGHLEILMSEGCPDDRMYVCTDKGDVIYFENIGTNLAGVAGPPKKAEND